MYNAVFDIQIVPCVFELAGGEVRVGKRVEGLTLALSNAPSLYHRSPNLPILSGKATSILRVFRETRARACVVFDCGEISNLVSGSIQIQDGTCQSSLCGDQSPKIAQNFK